MMFDMDGMILPAPHPAFEWQRRAGGPALVCVALAPYADHFFTTRAWALGSRQPAVSEPDLWSQIAGAMAVPADRLVRMRQVHGADAVDALPGAPPQRADIVVAGDGADLALAVQTADCVPLLLVDVESGATAAAHAGWRGLAAGVPARAVEALARAYNAPADRLMAVAGPSIGACCYEVGLDVRDAFLANGFDEQMDRWFLTKRQELDGNPPFRALPAEAAEGHWYFDGWRCLRDQLESAGVRPALIFSPHLCTASHAAFCSYRRDGAPAGRLAGVVRVPAVAPLA
jgi:polyphenol oxidase